MRKRTNARVARNAERCPGMSFMVEKSHPDFVLWRPDAAFLFRVAADESVHPERRRTFGCRHGRGIMTGQFARTPAPSVGVDVVPTDRVRDLLESSDRTVERILTEDEIAECTNDLRELDLDAVAGRIAAKEAAFKALHRRGPLPWRGVRVRTQPAGWPSLEFSREVASGPDGSFPETSVSISHDGGIAVAVVCIA